MTAFDFLISIGISIGCGLLAGYLVIWLLNNGLLR